MANPTLVRSPSRSSNSIVSSAEGQNNEFIDPKEQRKIIFTMMKYGRLFRATPWHLTPASVKVDKF